MPQRRRHSALPAADQAAGSNALDIPLPPLYIKHKFLERFSLSPVYYNLKQLLDTTPRMNFYPSSRPKNTDLENNDSFSVLDKLRMSWISCRTSSVTNTFARGAIRRPSPTTTWNPTISILQ